MGTAVPLHIFAKHADKSPRLKHFPPNRVFFASRSPTPVESTEVVKAFATMPGF